MNAETLNHADREHSELGASICARFWNCPGSVRLSRGAPRRESKYAQVGTAAHELGETCLRSGQDAIEYVDRTIAGQVVDSNMAEGVQVYLDTCRPLMQHWHLIEGRFTLEQFGPPAPMFGTADFVAYDAETRTLHVVDYKNGWLPVEAENNAQLRYYALGAMLLLGAEKPVSRVEVRIVQPNGLGHAVKRAEIDAVELVEWSVELIDRARAALEPDAPLAPGAWCKFCPAAPCTAQTDASLATARLEFADVVSASDTAAAPPEVRLLSLDEIAEILKRADALEQWLTDVRGAAVAALQRGRAVGDWKLVHGNGRTRWRNSETAARTLLVDHDLPESAVYEPAPVVSPAKARVALAGALVDAAKARGEKLTKKSAEATARLALADLTETPLSSSGPQLVRGSDPRPALLPGSEFTALPEPELPA